VWVLLEMISVNQLKC